MPVKHALITIAGDEIAPRFDMTAEAVIIPLDVDPEPANPTDERRHLVLAHVSSEELCDVVTRSGISTVVCGGIEEDYYHYLRWKRVTVISDVMGPLEQVIERLAAGTLQDKDTLYGRS